MRITRLLSVVALALLPAAVRAEEQTGEQIYKRLCSQCHGPSGEGTQKAPAPLIGGKSVAQLANLIDRTMPEDDPDRLDAAGSKKVAQFIHDKFYSPAAQAKLKPPRIELTHLTVNQYRSAVADVVGSFRTPAKLDDKQGLRGEYYNARNFRGNARLLERIDHEVNFDFKLAGPQDASLKEKFDPHQFSIRWEGSVLAPDTGAYEFIVRTDHALRLWVNGNQKAAIDGWVKSGSETEFRASVFLLAGRAYPIKLEFSKAKQGVDDTKKNPNPPPRPAFISLQWKRPKGAPEVIPARHLSPTRSPEVCVVETPFPPDDRSLGWERGTGISKEWDAATTDAAIETASYVLARQTELASTSDGAPDRAAKLRAFALRFAERAFRRPLTEDEKRLFVERQFAESAADPELALKRVVLLVLKSPRFLYPDAGSVPEQYAVASRLALALWDSLPDRELLDAAAAGKLGTRAEVARHAERMLADPRAKAKLREFLFTWLKLDHAPELAKDAKRFPGFDATIANDLRTSLELFLDDVVWSESSDFRRLLLADETYVNGRLAKFYGVELPRELYTSRVRVFGYELLRDAPFTKVKLEPDRRAGVLTHPYMLSALAYMQESSPIHRGVFVARGLFGINIRPPQEAFTPLAPDLHPSLTTRERVSLQTKPAACASCHAVMNPLGFPLENFDAVGRYRDKDRDKPIDPTGTYETRAGTIAKINGAKELAKLVAESPEVHEAFAERLFHHLAKQPVMAYGVQKPEEFRKSFAENGFNIRKLVVEEAIVAALARRDAKPKQN
jgi:cytochrome c553